MIVPVYPEKFDMVENHGEAIGDIWHGHVQSVDFKNHTVDVYFYIPTRNLRMLSTRTKHVSVTTATIGAMLVPDVA